MRFFDRDGKWNWIDENNVFVGYSNSQDCCECAGWFYSNDQPNKGTEGDLPQDLDITAFRFDPQYFHEFENSGDYDSGGAVTFRLVADEQAIYLTLFNAHNGYYAHGFEMKIGDAVVNEGYL